MLCLVVLLAAAPAWADGLAGNWRVDVPRTPDFAIPIVLMLRQDAAGVTGYVVPNKAGLLPLKNTRLAGGTATFDTDWNWSFRVSRDQGALRVAVSMDGWKTEAAYTGRPAAADDVDLPATIPPPALRDLPDNGLARTPPMGWNSWNHFGEAVNDAVVRHAADALVRSGMAAAGYVYINIDDTWERGRDAAGRIVPNSKFPDMRALANYVHGRGLRLGIYSSPGVATCGGYPGSYAHEEDDARTYASWGIDYLKYDWCSAGRMYPNAQLRAVYQRMGEALERCGRPIVYSLCEYGDGDVWTWGPRVAGNLWRTTGDIADTWEAMSANGFSQSRLAPYAGPGRWNDPDMLEVGNGGMTPTEYRTHFSLWCLLAAPLIAGNDLDRMSAETLAILTNREAIAVDQDPLGRQGSRVATEGATEVWAKPLSGGALAVGIFNRGRDEAPATVTWAGLGLKGAPRTVRDLWAHAAVPSDAGGYRCRIPGHGAVLLRLN